VLSAKLESSKLESSWELGTTAIITKVDKVGSILTVESVGSILTVDKVGSILTIESVGSIVTVENAGYPLLILAIRHTPY
jgi:hypothetical protein